MAAAGGRLSVGSGERETAGGGLVKPLSCCELPVSRCSKRPIFRAIAPLDMKCTKHTPSPANVGRNVPSPFSSTPFLFPASLYLPSSPCPPFISLPSLSPSLPSPNLSCTACAVRSRLAFINPASNQVKNNSCSLLLLS